jgi:16S rRNA (guanine527-N7)-methyltransferase
VGILSFLNYQIQLLPQIFNRQSTIETAMDPARIAELLQPFLEPLAVSDIRGCHSEPASAGEEPAFLSPTQLQSILTYINLLLRWNARVNLTAIRDPEQIVTRHFGESLFAARHLFPVASYVGTAAQARPERSRRGCPAERSSAGDNDLADGRGTAALQGRVAGSGKMEALAPEAARPTVADLGSGAGFPGLPIKLWAPDISLTLIESNHEKAAFLREVTRALTLTDVNVLAARAETLTASFSLVTLRAVERFADVLPIAARLVAPAGRLALLISSAQLDNACASLPDFRWLDAEPIPLSHSRVLAVAHRPIGADKGAFTPGGVGKGRIPHPHEEEGEPKE